MLQPLYARQRYRLLRWSVCVCAGALLLVPLAFAPVRGEDPGAAQNTQGPSPSGKVAPVPAQLRFPVVVVRRDPFAAPLFEANAQSLDADLPPVLPPNAGAAAGTAVAPEERPAVRAIVLGENPRALIDTDGRLAVVGVGSELAGSVVERIDAGGVELQDGRRLRLLRGLAQ